MTLRTGLMLHGVEKQDLKRCTCISAPLVIRSSFLWPVQQPGWALDLRPARVRTSRSTSYSMRGKWQLGPQNTPQMHISRKLYPALDTWLLYKGWHIFLPFCSGSSPSAPFLASILSLSFLYSPV